MTDGDDDQLRVWDGESGRLIRQIVCGTGLSRDFAISSDNKVYSADVVYGGGDPKSETLAVAVNDLATGRQQSHTSWRVGERGGILKLSPCTRWIALTSHGDVLKNVIKVFDTATGAEQSSYTVGNILGDAPLAFGRTGSLLAIVSRPENHPKQQIHVIDLDRKKVRRVIPDVGQGGGRSMDSGSLPTVR